MVLQDLMYLHVWLRGQVDAVATWVCRVQPEPSVCMSHLTWLWCAGCAPETAPPQTAAPRRATQYWRCRQSLHGSARGYGPGSGCVLQRSILASSEVVVPHVPACCSLEAVQRLQASAGDHRHLAAGRTHAVSRLVGSRPELVCRGGTTTLAYADGTLNCTPRGQTCLLGSACQGSCPQPL